MGYRFRLHSKDLPGSPDIVLPKYKTVIFVHGCFWHRHENCKYASTPKTRQEFWNKKFTENIKNQISNNPKLKELFSFDFDNNKINITTIKNIKGLESKAILIWEKLVELSENEIYVSMSRARSLLAIAEFK